MDDKVGGKTFTLAQMGIVDLSVAMANDIALRELMTIKAAAMKVPNLKTLRAQAGEVANDNIEIRVLREIVA